MGLGQPETYGLGLLSNPSFFVERHHRTLGVSGAGGYVRCTLRFGICYFAWRVVCRAPRLWTH